MGCNVSVPEETQPRAQSIGKTERSKPRSAALVANGAGKGITPPSDRISNGGNGISSAVSLEVNEEISKEPPKLNVNGHLMPEEVVRRTSSSLNVSHITVGTQAKGGKEIQISVR